MYLVFDVGATFVKYAWMEESGAIIEKHKMPTKCRPGEKAEDFISSVVEVYEKYKEKGNMEGIAMGLPGQIDVDRGIVYGGGGLKYLHEVRLGEILSKRCDGVRVSLENDGKCAALAEVWMGNAKDVENACVIVCGTGIGGGIIKEKRIHRGNRLLAGELSFGFDGMTREDIKKIRPIEEMTIAETFDNCPYAITTKCSTSALVHKVAKAKGLPDEEVNGEKIYQWVAEGDIATENILEDTYFHLAILCLNLYVNFDPDIILIGGGISAQPAFLEGIRKYVNQIKPLSKIYSGVQIDVCKFRNDSNLLGALYNFKQKYKLI